MPQDPSSQVNAKITDAIAATTTATVGEAAAVAVGMFFQVEAQAFGIGMQNAVGAQQGMTQVGTAIVATACARIMESMKSSK